MSYDLFVYARKRVDRAVVVELINSVGGAVDEDASSDDCLIVARGARRSHSFTVELAKAVEPEDVPEEVTAAVLDPKYLYEIQLGDFSSGVPLRFARKLAQASSGAVIDQQEGTVWSRGKLRTPPKVEHGLVDIVELRWYLTNRIDPVRAAATWLELTRRHFPEAVPRRWGTFEPLSEKADPEHPEAFVRYVGRRDGAVYFKASAPAIEGGMCDFEWGRRFDAVSLKIHRAALEQEGWRAPLQRLFVEFASRMDAVVATAEVVRNAEWSGRTLLYGPKTERSFYLGPVTGWAGLPPYPVWWIWFGSGYVPLVRSHLDPAQVKVFDNGIFHARSIEPTDRDMLCDQLSDGKSLKKLFGRIGRAVSLYPPWLPSKLLAISRRAMVIPPTLR